MKKTILKFPNLKENFYAAVQSIRKQIKNVNSIVTMTVNSSNSIAVEVQDSEKDNMYGEDCIFRALEEEEQSEKNLDIRISTKDIFPNLLINEFSSTSSIKEDDGEKKLKLKNKPSIFYYPEESKEDEDSCSRIQMEKETLKKTKHHQKFEKPQKIEKKSISSQTDHEVQPSDDESYPESLAIVQNKLNEALFYIKKNKMNGLEDFLYNFRTKYMYLNQKVQIKWRLLMAFCKESKKEYERASILYSQVIELAQASPNLLSLDIADIYHRLGLCYSEIRVWNEGIIAYVKALNELKLKNKRIKYAECMNNLGTLYLNAGSISEAEKCFLMSYSIKSKEYSEHSKKLLSSLFNLYECNIIQRNYDQAKNILTQLNNIIINIKDNKMLLGGTLRRKGKLYFLKGELEKAEQKFQEAAERLEKDYQYSLEYGELLNNMGLLKLDLKYFSAAKDYFERSLEILNFYYTKDSIPIQSVKKNIELIEDMMISKRKPIKKAPSCKE